MLKVGLLCGSARDPNADRRRNLLIGFASVGSVFAACSQPPPISQLPVSHLSELGQWTYAILDAFLLRAGW